MFIYDDGGRSSAGYKGKARDCVVRSIAIATELPYQAIYDQINDLGSMERSSKKRSGKSSARTGVHKQTSRKFLEGLGWIWKPTMFIGAGCRVHLRSDELPSGRLIIAVSKHYTAMIDGVIHDTFDCSRDGSRCVYGYYTKGGK